MDKWSQWSARPSPALFRLHHSTTNGPSLPERNGLEQWNGAMFAVMSRSARARRRGWLLASALHWDMHMGT